MKFESFYELTTGRHKPEWTAIIGLLIKQSYGGFVGLGPRKPSDTATDQLIDNTSAPRHHHEFDRNRLHRNSERFENWCVLIGISGEQGLGYTERYVSNHIM